ncbi:MAG: FAD-dependent oxidoreductase [Proteobacteria bacterium]|nr:FAD-dependent oxidoreductase [Pseudomonadota bacterium]
MTKSDHEFADNLDVFGGAVPSKPTRFGLGTVTEPAREIPVFTETDVLVVGGGPAGTAAAVAAARLGAGVILAERYNHLGGLATGGLVIWIDRMTDWSGHQVIQGIGGELMERLPADAILGPDKQDWGSREPELVAQWKPRHSAFHDVVQYAPMIDPEWLKLESLKAAREAGVELLLHTWIAAPIVEDGQVRGAILESKQGRMAVRASVVVDSTGDGDMFSRSGEAHEGDIDEENIHHCANTAFLWAGCDTDRWFRFQREEPEAFREMTKRGRETLRNFIMPMAGWRNDVVVFMGPRFSGYDVTDIDDLTAVELRSREAMLELWRFYRENAPGFEEAWVMLTAPQLGARHSRRLVGAARMTAEEWRVGRVYRDEVGVSPSLGPNFPAVSVPYGALLPARVDNLLVAGRHISSDAQTHTFMREIPQCWMTGHAAGVAAGVAADRGTVPRDLDPAELQSALRRQGAYLRPEAELAAAE